MGAFEREVKKGNGGGDGGGKGKTGLGFDMGRGAWMRCEEKG